MTAGLLLVDPGAQSLRTVTARLPTFDDYRVLRAKPTTSGETTPRAVKLIRVEAARDVARTVW